MNVCSRIYVTEISHVVIMPEFMCSWTHKESIAMLEYSALVLGAGINHH